jgi:uncharacterized metal-binding protein YceD (DUF177 family)
MMQQPDDFVLDWSHDVHALGERGMEAERVGTAEERAAIAAALDLVALDELQVRYALKPKSRGRVRFRADVAAHVTQSCVVSLAPVPARLALQIDIEFCPAEEIGEDTAVVDPLGPDGPEPIVQGRLEIGRVVYEEIAAALDPYPRAPSAEFAAPVEPEDPGHKPFAALARLKQRE